ncbi:MAG: SH3 domain-containing protein [Muribaculaceae bacterium]|nr:SH3 domain-containing protein [Muribaculaceae bacterium]
MRRLLQIVILMVLAALSVDSAFAREYGDHPERSKYKYTVTPGKKLNVRETPSTKGRFITQLKPGDVVYISDTTLYEGSGYQWAKISDPWGRNISRDAYVTNLNRLSRSENPQYVAPSQDDIEIENAVKSSQTAAKWILLVLSVIAAIFYLYLYFSEDADDKIFGTYHNGMRRTFFFNIAPYRTVIIVTLLLLAAVATSLAIVLLIGGLGFVLLWIVKILCYVLMWVGIIVCVASIIACIGGEWGFIVTAVIGGIIWYYDDEITAFGDRCAEIGLRFFHEFNILGYSADMFMEYWKPVLLVTCIPLAIFLCLAVIWMLVAGLLIGYEKYVTSRYNIKHPCPHCHHPSEPAVYLSKGKDGYMELPDGIQLRPGFYGLFHITHPRTYKRMPTMLLNGRDKLARRCGSCGCLIKAKEGTELHLSVAGSAMSGKSTLTYRLIAELFSRAGKENVKFTDVDNTMPDISIIDKVKAISSEGKISEENLPRKTATDDLSSMQMIVKRQKSTIPYRLFINDVGGEHFDPSNNIDSSNTNRYFRNLDSLIVILDPLTTEFSESEESDEFKEWLEKNDTENVNKVPLKYIKNVISNQLIRYKIDTKRVHLNIVLTKKDLGYLPADVDPNSQDQLKTYLEKHLGLESFLYWAQQFASCNVFAVSAMAEKGDANIDSLYESIMLRQLGLNY